MAQQLTVPHAVVPALRLDHHRPLYLAIPGRGHMGQNAERDPKGLTHLLRALLGAPSHCLESPAVAPHHMVP
jgi:hypothetical protein